MAHRSILILPLILGCVLAVPAPSPAQGIGAVEEVRAEAFATPPSASRDRVAMARLVVANEAIETGADAAVGLRFTDQTIFRIGPASLVTLDRFLFDPNAKSGAMALNLGRGAFRFISGTMPKEGIAVRTPTALIGVRGTDFLVRVTPAGATAVTVFEGSVVIQPLGGTAQILVLPGQRASVDSGGGTPSLGAAPPDESGGGFLGSNELNSQISSAPAGSSGGTVGPSRSPPVPTMPPPMAPQPMPPVSPPVYVPQKTMCFTGDTLVLTAAGPRRIDSITAGDWVLGLAEEGGTVWRAVRALQRHGAEAVAKAPEHPLIALRIKGEELRVTANHLILTELGWREAGALQVGAMLRAADGGLVALEALRQGLEPEAVFHLDVEVFPAYVAGGIFVSG